MRRVVATALRQVSSTQHTQCCATHKVHRASAVRHNNTRSKIYVHSVVRWQQRNVVSLRMDAARLSGVWRGQFVDSWFAAGHYYLVFYDVAVFSWTATNNFRQTPNPAS